MVPTEGTEASVPQGGRASHPSPEESLEEVQMTSPWLSPPAPAATDSGQKRCLHLVGAPPPATSGSRWLLTLFHARRDARRLFSPGQRFLVQALLTLGWITLWVATSWALRGVVPHPHDARSIPIRDNHRCPHCPFENGWPRTTSGPGHQLGSVIGGSVPGPDPNPDHQDIVGCL